MNCTNCQKFSETEYCADCEQYRERLERLRADQKQFWRDVRSGKRQLVHPRKKPMGSAHFLAQCKQHGQKLVEGRGGQLPLSGQDAALPPGDRT